MVDLTRTKEYPREQLFDMLVDIKVGMLGIENGNGQMQPMAPYADRENGCIWFLTKTDSDLYAKLGVGARSHFCVIGENQNYHACLSGVLTQRQEHSQIDKMWNDIVAAWFEHGKDDPLLALLEMKLDRAEIWASVGNPLVFGWEIAKAHWEGDEPDLGVRTSVSFN